MKVNERVVRERFQLLKEKFKSQMSKENKGSGIICDYGELEQLLQDLIDLEKDSVIEVESLKKNKEEEEREKGKAVRKRCLERMDENKGKRAKYDMESRMEFFRERSESVMKDKEEERKVKGEELALRKEELELQKDMIKMQQKQFEAQQQSFQNTILQMQAQQTELLKLLLQRNEN